MNYFNALILLTFFVNFPHCQAQTLDVDWDYSDRNNPIPVALSYSSYKHRKPGLNTKCPDNCKGKFGNFLGCVPYNQDYQAVNLPEALRNFRNLANPGDQNPDRWHINNGIRVLSTGGEQDSGANFQCPPNSPTCGPCMARLINQLDTKGFLTPGMANQLRYHLGVENVRNTGDCSRFNFENFSINSRTANHLASLAGLWDTAEDAAKKLASTGEQLQSYTRALYAATGEVSPVFMNEIGHSFPIQCYKRGEEINKDGMVRLCDVCWSWRQMPPNYHPRMINELTCNTDLACLSGKESNFLLRKTFRKVCLS